MPGDIGTAPDHSVLSQLLTETERQLRSRRPIVHQTTPLLGLDVDAGEIVFGPGLRIRPVSARDIEDWVNPAYGAYDLPISAEQILGVTSVVVFEGEKGQEDATWEATARQEVEHVITAVRLITGAAVQTAFTDQTTNGFFRGLGGSRSYHAIGSHYVLRGRLTAPQVDAVKHVWQRLQHSPNRKKVELAISRWSTGLARSSDEDKIIDYWIGLESLFAPDSTSEITYRASIRIAAFLGSKDDERERLYRQMKGSYIYRSGFVHGNPGNKKQAAKESCLTISGAEERTRHVLRVAILRILELDTMFDPSKVEVQLLRDSATRDAEPNRVGGSDTF